MNSMASSGVVIKSGKPRMAFGQKSLLLALFRVVTLGLALIELGFDLPTHMVVPRIVIAVVAISYTGFKLIHPLRWYLSPSRGMTLTVIDVAMCAALLFAHRQIHSPFALYSLNPVLTSALLFRPRVAWITGGVTAFYYAANFFSYPLIDSLEHLSSMFFTYIAALGLTTALPHLINVENEEKLSAHEKRYETIIQTSIDGFWVTDTQGHILDVNDAYCRLTGYSRDEMLKMNISDIGAIATSADIGQCIQKIMKDGYGRFESRHRCKDGRIVDVELSVNYLPASEIFFFFIRDVTERKKVEQELKVKERELYLAREAEKLKDDFIGMVSHELRTPLTVFKGAVEVAMTKGVSPEEVQELLEDADRGAVSLSYLLDNLIELSRYQSHRLKLATERLDVAQLIRSSVEAGKVRLDSHKFSFDIGQGLPLVEVDRIRVQLIFRNLLDNAAKYSPPGSEIHTSVRQEDDHLLIGVSDHGLGIPKADQEKLFQPFQRLDGITPVKGLGLGLLVCRRLVEAHGGKIWCESEPGQGATFCFTLPLSHSS